MKTNYANCFVNLKADSPPSSRTHTDNPVGPGNDSLLQHARECVCAEPQCLSMVKDPVCRRVCALKYVRCLFGWQYPTAVNSQVSDEELFRARDCRCWLCSSQSYRLLPRQRFLGTRTRLLLLLCSSSFQAGAAQSELQMLGLSLCLLLLHPVIFLIRAAPRTVFSLQVAPSLVWLENSLLRALGMRELGCFCNFAEWLFLLRQALRVVFRHAGVSAVRCVAGRGGAVNCWSWVYLYAGFVTYSSVAQVYLKWL